MDKKLSKKDLFWSYFLWLNWSQQSYNYERLQAMGFTFALIPAIKKLYDKVEDQIAALKRHMVFFNTEPSHIGISILGMVLAMEEKKANGGDISDEDINAVKIGLMGPLAGVGDSWFQGIVFPILLSLGAGMAIEGNYLGPFVFVIPFLVQMFAVGWTVFNIGYNQGKSAIANILGNKKFKVAIESLTVLGMLVVGTMAAQRVNIALNIGFTVGQTPVDLQSILDSLAPGLVPLLVVLGVYGLLSKKVNPIWIVLLLFVLGILGSLLGFLKLPGAGG
jgi:PTS system mannose-specific IID component